MKKLSIVLFVVLSLAIIGLYFLHFTGSKKKDTPSVANEAPAGGLAYVNIDTVIFKFDMFLDRRDDLMTKQKSAEAELNSKGTQYEKGVKDYQDKVNKGLDNKSHCRSDGTISYSAAAGTCFSSR